MNRPFLRSPFAGELCEKIAERTARTGVIGLGYAGLPLAVELGTAGFEVLGVDLDAAKCNALNGGRSPIADVPHSAIAALVSAGKFHAVNDISLAGDLDTVSICVPTPLSKTREPDLSYVVSAAQAVKSQLRAGMLVIVESTTYPGATEELVQAILEETGMKVGRDFFLAFSPERVDPANPTWNIKNVPKVVGGVTDDCAALTEALYAGSICPVVRVSSPRAAEMVKLLENTFRAVNVGLVNEFALMCDRIGIDVWEVIDAASTKPFGFMPFYPGPGLGGHCIPVDPLYLSWKVRQVGFEARFIDLASQVNGLMPSHVVQKVTEALNDHRKAVKGAQIVVMGVAYKPEVGDVRESPAIDVIELLLKKGARVSYHDPFVPSFELERGNSYIVMNSEPYDEEIFSVADCVVILTAHSSIDYERLTLSAPLIVDARNAIKSPGPNTYRLGTPNPTARSAGT